jgi:crotonobetainyl-CoA:carnitine CoA-transferase CaiB-like acyl-CoA transferase
MSPLPLDGITVVSIEQAVAAPFATRQLADLGARVIKIERPGSGDFARGYDRSVMGLASYFVWLNRSKESLALDLKDERSMAIVRQLIERADVFVENLGPGASARLGLSAKALRAVHPSLIVCDISGYGEDGPWSDRKAYDLLVQAEAGLVAITGTPEAPARAGISIADISGGMYAYSGILVALYRRATTGEGSALDVSLFDSLAEWMSQPAYFTAYSGKQPERIGVEHATIAPYALFTTRDGASLVVAVQNEPEWASLCVELLGDPSLALDPRFSNNTARAQHRGLVNDLVGAKLAALDLLAATALLRRAKVAYAEVNSVQAAVDHPVLAGRDRWREVETESGTVRALVPPGLPIDIEPRMDGVPALGANTASILDELGYDAAAISNLEADGVIEIG